MKVLTTEGIVWLRVSDPTTAKQICAHWHAVYRYLHTRDELGLLDLGWLGVGMHWFETDPVQIDGWADDILYPEDDDERS